MPLRDTVEHNTSVISHGWDVTRDTWQALSVCPVAALDTSTLRYGLDQISFRLENKALTKVVFSVSQFQSTQGDTSLLWVICGNLQKAPSSNAQCTDLQTTTKDDRKAPIKCSVPRGNVHSTTCYYTVQYLSKRTALAALDSEMDTLLFLYLKQNTCKDIAIGAVSRQLAWKERVQAES